MSDVGRGGTHFTDLTHCKWDAELRILTYNYSIKRESLPAHIRIDGINHSVLFDYEDIDFLKMYAWYRSKDINAIDIVLKVRFM